jgi:hypothetical protein
MKTIYQLQEPEYDPHLVGNHIPGWKLELIKLICYN